MRIQKEKAIIIAFRSFRDADKLAICLGITSGKLSLIVKGASKLTSKRSPSLDGGNIVFLSYYKGKGDLDLLLEIKLINDLKDIKSTPLGINSLLYILEVLNNFTQPSLNSSEYFKDVNTILEMMNSNLLMIPMFLCLFQLKTLSYFGFEPLIDRCSICSMQLKENEARIINTDSIIGYICSRHFDNLDKDRLIKDNILKVQKYFLKCDVDNVLPITNTKSEWFSMLKLHNSWLESILEKKINSFELILNYE